MEGRKGAKVKSKANKDIAIGKKERPVSDKHPTAMFAGGIIIKWFREIRSNYWNSTTMVPPELPAKPVINRSDPFYYSEGKGSNNKKKKRKNRRYSFNDRQVTPPPTFRRRTRTNGFEAHRPATFLPLAHTMMPSRSTPNLQTSSKTNANYKYLQPIGTIHRDDDSPPPAPPVRDSSTLKSIKYGPGHEKFPSWPVPAAADTPQALRAPPSGGSHRSKSWTDHTNYPKEKVVTYTRPYMKRQHSNYTQQKLKTVMERCEKILPETFESRFEHPPQSRVYLDYPERDTPSKQLTKADLDHYARSYPEPLKYLTKSGLEEFIEYTRASYEDALLFPPKAHDDGFHHHHQKQLSYAQSEGYHSYVSSTDSTSTPFLDRLRRDSEAVVTSSREEPEVERREGRDSVVTTSSGSVSSSETLKWHGSMSDVSSVAGSSCNLAASRQLIAHSARVQTPQRHHSESVLYMSGAIDEGNLDTWKDREMRNNSANKLKLFPVNTYTVQEPSQRLKVADRISELERQKYSYLDPEKKHKVPDPTLKAIQKKALLSFYERHHKSPRNSWRSEPHLAQPVPQLPPRLKVQLPSRRASSASDYASNNTSKRSSLASISSKTSKTTDNIKHQYSNSCGSLSTDLLGPVIMGPSISVDDWVSPDQPPERPPKNPHLKVAYPDLFREPRVPSPDLPPPPSVQDGEVITPNDDPFPPPPPECSLDLDCTSNGTHRTNNSIGSAHNSSTLHQFPSPQSPIKQTVGLPDQSRLVGVRSSIRTRPGGQIIQQVSSKPYHSSAMPVEKLGFPSQAAYAERSSAKYPQTQKLVIHGGSVAVSQKVVNGSDQYRAEPIKLRKNGMNDGCKERERQPPPLQPRQERVNQSMRGSKGYSREEVAPSGRDGRSQSLSQSKASYLASRRERDRIVPDSESGSYKRTMSPNGHSLPSDVISTPKVTPAQPQKDTVWSLNRSKDSLLSKNHLIFRRSSMNDKGNSKKPPPLTLSTEQSIKEEKTEAMKKVVLPDVLPMNAKLMSSRSQRPPNLNLAENGDTVSKSPPRGSPFAPLRSTNLSNPPLLASCISSSFMKVTPPSPRRSSPQIKAALAPSSSPLKLLPLRTSPATSSVASSSPLATSPLSSPNSSPKPLSSPDISPPLSPKMVEQSLQLIQRTEVVLRVNTSTSDASSQTEKEEEEALSTPLPSRKKLQEEIECDKLSEDFVNHLPTSDRLKELLVPGPEHKKPTDYVCGLFKVEVTSRPRPENSPFRSRNNTPSSSPPPTTPTTKINSALSSPSTPGAELQSPLSGSSSYFTTSEPKAKFLTRFSLDMNQCHVVKDTKDLTIKKEELVGRLDRKLEVLRSEQLVVEDESKINNELGENVEAYIRRLARPHEADKFRLHIEEVGKITSLLLGLSGRLARAENALNGMQDDHPEKQILESKRDKLLEQLDEAKKLKECIDKRSVNVSNILSKYLNSDEYTDYDHFINMKAKLIMDSKEISDKIKLGEEQLIALKQTLIVTDCIN